MTYDFDDFKFKVGDIVRHRASKHTILHDVGYAEYAGVIVYRSLHEGADGHERTYSISAVENFIQDVSEVELELVDPQ